MDELSNFESEMQRKWYEMQCIDDGSFTIIDIKRIKFWEKGHEREVQDLLQKRLDEESSFTIIDKIKHFLCRELIIGIEVDNELSEDANVLLSSYSREIEEKFICPPGKSVHYLSYPWLNIAMGYSSPSLSSSIPVKIKIIQKVLPHHIVEIAKTRPIDCYYSYMNGLGPFKAGCPNDIFSKKYNELPLSINKN